MLNTGATILEIFIVIALMGILSLIAVASYSDTVASFERANARKGMIADIRRARVSARTKNARVIFRIKTAEGACASGYEYGYDFYPFNKTPTAEIEQVIASECYDSSHILLTLNEPGSQNYFDDRFFFNQDGMLVNAVGAAAGAHIAFTFRNVAFLSIEIFPLGSNTCRDPGGGGVAC